MRPTRLLLNDLKKALLTLILALVSAFIFQRLRTPAPFLLGALFGIWLIGGIAKPIRPHLGIPRWLYVPVILGMAVMIGSMFSPDMVAKTSSWLWSLITLALATLIATILAAAYLIQIRGYSRNLALLCSLPGGQAEILLISHQLVNKDYVVVLCHLARVTVVFCATPLVLSISQGESGITRSYDALTGLPGIADLPVLALIQFVTLAGAGYLAGRLLRLPIPHLLGPIFLSMIAHLLGVVSIPRINEFVILAQLVVGGLIGSRLAQVDLSLISKYLIDAIVNATILVMTFLIIALTLSVFIDIPFLDLFLAFSPGGIYEITLLTLLFGFDLGFVAFHHTFRVLLIFLCLPLVVKPK